MDWWEKDPYYSSRGGLCRKKRILTYLKESIDLEQLVEQKALPDQVEKEAMSKQMEEKVLPQQVEELE